jgi:DNA primase
MYVNQALGVWLCRSCQAGGDVFKFVQRSENLTFPEAARKLAALAGVELPMNAEQKQQQRQRQRILSVLAIAAEFYQRQLSAPASKAAQQYLYQQRRLSPAAAREFKLGYAPDSWDSLLRFLNQQGVDREMAQQAGLLASKEGKSWYDRFRNRIIFPICDAHGAIISLGGRALGQQDPAKYINGPETKVFKKHSTLYNLHNAKAPAIAKGRLLLVEGYFDVLTLAANGLKEVAAPMGTALTETQVSLLPSREVVLVFDGDAAGRRAARKSLEVFLKMELSPKVLWLPPGEDPDSLVRSRGLEHLEQMLSQTGPLLQSSLDEILNAPERDRPEVKSQIVSACGDIIKLIKDSIIKTEYMKYVADKLGLSPNLVAGSLGQPRIDIKTKPAAPGAKPERLTSQRLLMESALSNAAAAGAFYRAGLFADIDQPDLLPIAQACVELLKQGMEATLEAMLQALAENPDACALVSAMVMRAAPQIQAEQIPEQINAFKRQKIKKQIEKLNQQRTIALTAENYAQAAALQKLINLHKALNKALNAGVQANISALQEEIERLQRCICKKPVET